MNGNKFTTGEILRKRVEVVKGQSLVGWAQKSLEPWIGNSPAVSNFNQLFLKVNRFISN